MRKLYVSSIRAAFKVSFAATLFLSLGLLSACSSKTTSSTVSLSFPDWAEIEKSANAKAAQAPQTMSAERDRRQVQIIAINVTAADMEPVVYLWHRQDKDNSEVPRTFKLAVTRGANRFVQVLAVYGGEKSTQFIYGDSLVDASGAEAKASITLELKNTSATAEGNVVGRYMTAPGVGPTGTFEYHFDPDQMPGGIPSMLVAKGEIFGGWFRSFMLSNRLVQYKLKSGAYLFDLSDNSQLFSENSPKAAMRVRIPKSYYDKNGNSVIADLEESPDRYLTVGYFGPGAAGGVTPSAYQVCYSSNQEAISRLYFDNSTLNLSNQIKWNAAVTPTGLFDKRAYIMQPVKPNGSGMYAAGGTDEAACSTNGSEFDTHLVFNHQKMMDGDEMFGFRGPFRTFTNGRYVSASLDGTTAYVDWQTLPGATDKLKGFTVFYRETGSSSVAHSDEGLRDDDDGYKCNEIAASKLFRAAVPAPTTPTRASILNVADVNAFDRLQVIVCPQAQDGTYYNSAVQISDNLGTASANGSAGLKVLGIASTGVPSGIVNAGTKLSKKVFSEPNKGDYTYFAPSVNGKLIPSSSLTSFKASLDNVTWADIPAASYGSYAAYKFSSLSSAFSAIGAATVDLPLYLKWSVSADYQLAEGLPSQDYTAPTVNISGTCVDVSSVVVVSDTNVVKPTIIDDFNNVANGTDLNLSYRLRYANLGAISNNCGDVTVPISSVAVSGSSCFSQADLHRKSDDLFSFVIDPTDSTASSCNLNNLSLAILSPFQDNTLGVNYLGTAGDNLLHSTLQTQSGAFMSQADLGSSLTSNRLKLNLAISGPAASFGFNVASLNLDGKVTETSRSGPSVMPTPVSITPPATHLSNGAPSNRISVAVTATPVPSSLTTATMSRFTFTSGANSKPGSFESMTSLDTSTVIGTATLWGSELLITRDATNNVKLLYVYRDGTGSAFGRSLVDVTPSAGINTTDKVFVVPSPESSSGSSAAFTLAFGNAVLYGALVADNGIQARYSPKLFLRTNAKIIGVFNRLISTNWFVSVLTTESGDLRIASFNQVPKYSSNSVNDPAGAIALSESAFGVDASPSAPPLVAQCSTSAANGHLFVVTTPSPGLKRVYRVTSTSGTENSPTAYADRSISDSLDQISCVGVQKGASTSVLVKLLAFTNSGSLSSTFPVYGFDDENGTCGAGTNANLSIYSLSTPTSSGRSIAPYRGNFGASSLMGFVYGNSGSGKFEIRKATFSSCGASSLILDETAMGALNQTTGQELTGLGVNSERNSKISVFGKNSQFFTFDLAN